MPIKRLLGSVLLCATAACASTKPAAPAATPTAISASPGELKLDPPDPARPTVGMMVTTASIQTIVADLDAFARALQLAMPLGQAALDQLLQGLKAGLPLGREQVDRLDPKASLALVATAGSTGMCLALTFKDAGLARRTLEDLVPANQRTPGASVWHLGKDSFFALQGRTLLAGDSERSLVSLGALAMEGQRAPRDGQVAVTLYPPAAARSQGVPLATLVEMASAAMNAKLEEAAKAPRPDKGKKGAKKDEKKGEKAADTQELTPAMSKLLIAFFKAAAQPVAESEAVHFVVKLDTTDGLRLRTEVVPLPGSPSAARTQTLPYALDAKLPVTDDRTTVFAFGAAGTGMTSLINALGSTGPAGKAMSQQFGKVLNEVVAGGSCTVKSWAPLENLCAIQLRPGVDPARALDSYAAAFKSSQAWQDEVLGKKKSKVTVKRSKDVVDVEIALSTPDKTSRELQRAMWGGDNQKFALQVRDGRLLQAQGPKPRAILASWSEPAKGGGAPIFTSVAGRTRGAEVLVFMDFMALLTSVSKTAQDPSMKQLGAMTGAVPGLAELRAPLVLALYGGKTTAFDIQFPYQSFANVAQVMRPFMGMMGGPPPPAAGAKP